MVWFVIGTLIAGAYFWWVLGFDAQLRLRADVYGYLNLAIESPSVLGVFGVYEHRSPGFPLIPNPGLPGRPRKSLATAT